MEWAIYVGSAIFLGTVAGLLYMRNRPLRDAFGNVVDEFGRPINTLSRDANVVLITLRSSNVPLSGYDLRQHVTMSRQNFYALIADLEHRDLIVSRVVNTHNSGIKIRVYELTDEGCAMFDDHGETNDHGDQVA